MSASSRPQPFALPPADCAFRGLAVAAARAALGGPRETLVGVLMGVRLAAATEGPGALSPASRQLRADAAKGWLSALALPAKTRAALLGLFAASAGNAPEAVGTTLEAVMEVTAPILPRVARSEVARLVERLRGPMGAGLPEVARDP